MAPIKGFALLPVLAVLLAACGGDDKPKLGSADSSRVADANVAITHHCVTSDPLGAAEGVDTLIRLYRQDPDAIYQPGGEGEMRTMRQVVADAASAVSRCDSQLADELDRALTAG